MSRTRNLLARFESKEKSRISDRQPGPSAAREQRIRERVYYLWLEGDCPEGRDAEYWERASKLESTAEHPDAGQTPNSMSGSAAGTPSGEPVEEAEIETVASARTGPPAKARTTARR